MIQAALLGGVFIGVLSVLPIISVANCCCLWFVLGGVLAAWLLQQNQAQAITPGEGALAGLLAGATGAVVWLLGAFVFEALMGPIMEQALRRAIDASIDVPPEVREAVRMMGESGTIRYAVGFVFQFLAGIIFATLGGLLGAAFFMRGVPPGQAGEVLPPPLP